MCEAMRRLMYDEIADELREVEMKGEMKKAREMALSLAGMGMSAEKIADVAKVSIKLVQEWLSGNAGSEDFWV